MHGPDINNDGKISVWEWFPYWFDKLRLFPRAFISMYIYLLWRVVEWFMALPDPTNAQAGLVSVVVGAGAAWFGLYVNSGKSNASTVVLPQQNYTPTPEWRQSPPTIPTNNSAPAAPPGDGRG